MSLFSEIKRRNVFRVAMAYAVVSWLVIQVADAAVPALQLPEWVITLVFLLGALGFVPTLIFAWAFELTPEGIKKQTEVDRSQSITTETGKKLNYITIAALVAAIAVVGADRFIFPNTGIAVPEQAATDEVSIAVLPFADMSPEKDQDYFSDGITEEILNGLAKLRTMKVAGRTSSFAFKGRNEDLREIGAALGVQHVLEGSVRKDGDRLRITAQLIKVSDGFHLWSETYDRELRDIFAVQDEISAAIVSELKGNLLGETAALAETRQIDIAVYEQYLAARKRIIARSNASLTEARKILEEIIAAEPDFPPALSSLAEVLLLLRGDSFFAYGDLDPTEAKEIAAPLLDRALELDPGFADAYAVRGLMLVSDGKWEEAETALLRAVELNPSLSNAWVWLANNAGEQGKADTAVGYLKEATTIDPLWILPNSNLIRYLAVKGQMDDAKVVLERLRPFHQNAANFHSIDGEVEAQTGELADSLRALRKAYDLAPDTPSISMQTALALLRLQKFEEAAEIAPAQFFMFRNFVSGNWDDALPMIRDSLGDNPLRSVLMFPYLIGLNHVGDFESVALLYEEYARSPQVMMDAGRGELMLMFLPAMIALDRDEDRKLVLESYAEFLDRQESQGMAGADLDNNWASYYAFAGDYDQAIQRLERAFARGRRWETWSYNPAFEPIKDDPRFLALKQRNLDAINSERAKFGWEPVEEVGRFISVD